MKFIDVWAEKLGRNMLYWFIVLFFGIITTLNIVLNVVEARSVEIDDVMFRIDHRDGEVLYLKDENGEELSFTKETINSFMSNVEMDYKGENVRREINEVDMIYLYYVDDVLVHEGSIMRISINGISVEEEPSSIELLYGVEELYDYLYYNNPTGSVSALAVLFILFFSSMIVYTDKFWVFHHFMSVKGGEPTEFFIMWNRMMPTIFMIILQILIINAI